MGYDLCGRRGSYLRAAWTLEMGQFVFPVTHQQETMVL
jgi:hypothetical protein